MAGKTLGGVGRDAPSAHIDDDDSRPRLIDEDDSRGLHSGPTVVDDQKVAEVLKKLRSLDRPPGPLTGITEAVVDADSGEPTRLESQPIKIDSGPAVQAGAGPTRTEGSVAARLEDVMYPLKREKAMGSGAITPAVGQPVAAADAARGTLFGRSIHLPDVNAPDAAEVELSSGAVHFLDGAPPALQPFPLADRPAVVVPPPTTAPAPRFHTPYDVDQHTQLIDPPSKSLKRIAAFVGGLGIAGAGLWAWWQYGGGHTLTAAPSAVATPAPAPPAIDPMPPSAAAPMPPSAAAPMPPPRALPAAAAPTAAIPAAQPAAAAPPAPAPAPPPPAATAQAEEAEPPARASAPGRSHTRRSDRHASSRSAKPTSSTKPAPPADDAEPAEPSKHPHKGSVVNEDPDATMAPSD